MKIVLTGGGSSGHVTPHLALVPTMQKEGWDISYIGSNGIERDIIVPTGIPYKQIASGKLRRYFSFQNFLDIFKVLFGILQSFFYLLFNRPDVVFSKGGFVSVPVSLAAWVLRVPVVTHESDVTPGLANKIIQRFSTWMLYTFDETGKYIGTKRKKNVGLPIRANLFEGTKEEGISIAGFRPNDDRPIVLSMGGGLGSVKLNEGLVGSLDAILEKFRLIHLTGKEKGNNISKDGYYSLEYASDELKHFYAAADMVVSRAGATSIFEFLSLQKPMLLIPLDEGSRGDQILNAKSFRSKGWAQVLPENEVNPDTMRNALFSLWDHKNAMREAQSQYSWQGAEDEVIQILRDLG